VGIKRVGVSIASSIMATIPAFAAVIAVLFLNENLSSVLAFGIILIVAGIILFEQDKAGNNTRGAFRGKDIAMLFWGPWQEPLQSPSEKWVFKYGIFRP